jgi:hypothetical protein
MLSDYSDVWRFLERRMPESASKCKLLFACVTGSKAYNLTTPSSDTVRCIDTTPLTHRAGLLCSDQRSI